MNLRFICFVLFICTELTVFAQNNLRVNVFDAHSEQALMGANVLINPQNFGDITDEFGTVVFDNLQAGEYEIFISFMGYENQTLLIKFPEQKNVNIYLTESENALDEVVLSATRSTRTIERIPTRVELIGAEELAEKVTMNPANISMVLRESTGIQMQQSSLSSANSTIRIQGLDGRYTQLLKDGFPLFGGFSGGLSVMQVPPVDLHRFEIIKGSSSTLYGGGAIAGLVNMVSKIPEEEVQLDIMLTQTQALGSMGNIFYAERKNKFGWVLFAGANYQKAYDADQDGFTNLPETQTYNINPKFFYYPNDHSQVWIGINTSVDQRVGGDVEGLEAGNSDSFYTEANYSDRFSTQFVYENQIKSNQYLSIKNSVSYFDRDLSIPDYRFQGEQWNTFSEFTYQWNLPKLEIDLGANVYSNSFEEKLEVNPRNQRDITYGLFTNAITDISEFWSLETGFRLDYSKDWGVFPLPRVSLLYNSKGDFSARLGGGLGYKIPDLFIEDAERLFYQGVENIDKSALDAEQSYGFNFDLNYQTNLGDNLRMSLNQLFYWTAIDDALLLTPNNSGSYVFENASGSVSSSGAETNLKFSYLDWRWFLNYAFIDTRLGYLAGNPQKPLTPKHNAGSVFMYEGEKWRLGLETYYTGKQILTDGTQTTDYVTMGILVVRNFPWGSLYTNFENLTNQIQSNYGPLVSPPRNNPTFAELYAPTDGFIFSLGVIIKPFGNHHEHH